MEQQRDFKGVWIPKEIWLNKELTLIEKAILVEIDSLDNEDHCTASNEYLAEFCNCSQSKVTRAIQKLKDLELIEVLPFNGRQRRISISKKPRQHQQKAEAASAKSRPNNIDNNINNKKSNSKELLQPEEGCLSSFKLSPKKPLVKKPNLFTKCINELDSREYNKDLRDALVDYLRVRLEMKEKPLFFNSWKGLLNKLEREFPEKDRIGVVFQSIERGYASFFPVGGENNRAGSSRLKFKESGANHVESFTKEDERKEHEFHKECKRRGMQTHF